MSFLDRLFGKNTALPDPALAWGDYNPPMPDFDVTQMSFGSLRFGDAFDAAAFLGRPSRFEWTQGEYGELLYAAGGFQMDYEGGRLAYLCFFIGPDDFVPQHGAFEFSKPRLRGVALDGIRLSRSRCRLSGYLRDDCCSKNGPILKLGSQNETRTHLRCNVAISNCRHFLKLRQTA